MKPKAILLLLLVLLIALPLLMVDCHKPTQLPAIPTATPQTIETPEPSPPRSPDNFPQVAAVNGGNNPVNGPDHTVNLPADIDAGDLLLVFFTSDGNPTIGFPGGWTLLFQEAEFENVRFEGWYRIADGEEGATINVTTVPDEATTHTSYRITGYSGTPEAGTAVVGSSVNPNPPSLTPTWGAKDTLWFACYGSDRDRTCTYPANYGDGRQDKASETWGCATGSARRGLNASPEDPGAFTLTLSEQWVANTVAVQPEEMPGERLRSVPVSPSGLIF